MACAPACFPAPAQEVSTPGPSSTPAKNAGPTLSKRGTAHAASVTPFWTVFDTMLRDVYSAQKNPDGIINMGIANNSLMEKDLLEYFSAHLTLDPTDLTYGTSLYGSTRLFDALAAHFNRADYSPVLPVKPSHIVTGPGCGPLLDQIFEHLADPGEACLAAAPYYNGFDADLMTRSRVKCIPVFSANGDGTEKDDFTGAAALRGFEEAIAEQAAQGTKCRAILVCNPNNPVGRCYDREALLAYGRFAEALDLHLVFDEIYALSTFPTSDNANPQPFISALNIDWAKEAGCNPGRIHLLTSASKDFGLNGFRVGTFITQHNPQLMAAMKVTCKLYMVASPADALFSTLLTDEAFYQRFVQTNRARLAEAYETIKAWCMHHAIPYRPSNAGHFLLVDFKRFLPQEVGGKVLKESEERETALWSKVLEERVCVTPGSNYHHPQLGWFRLTFSLQQDVLLKGLGRLERALGLASWPGIVASAEQTPASATLTATQASSAQSSSLAQTAAKRALEETPQKHEQEQENRPPPRKRANLEGTHGPRPLTNQITGLVGEDYEALRQLQEAKTQGRSAVGCM